MASGYWIMDTKQAQTIVVQCTKLNNCARARRRGAGSLTVLGGGFLTLIASASSLKTSGPALGNTSRAGLGSRAGAAPLA